MSCHQMKHYLLYSSMFAAYQGWDFQWGQGELDAHGEPDACLMWTSLLAKVSLFLGWAEFCQLLSSVKFTAFTEA